MTDLIHWTGTELDGAAKISVYPGCQWLKLGMHDDEAEDEAEVKRIQKLLGGASDRQKRGREGHMSASRTRTGLQEMTSRAGT
jgi:hypothetical protein